MVLGFPFEGRSLSSWLLIFLLLLIFNYLLDIFFFSEILEALDGNFLQIRL